MYSVIDNNKCMFYESDELKVRVADVTVRSDGGYKVRFNEDYNFNSDQLRELIGDIRIFVNTVFV